MASTLTLNTAMSGDHWLISGGLAAGGTLPTSIFLYTNTGDGSLGEYYGVCNLSDLSRFQVLTLGTPQTVFGNKYLRHDEVKIKVALSDSPKQVADAVAASVTSLSAAYANQVATSTVYNIP